MAIRLLQNCCKPLPQLVYCLDQGANVSVAEGEGLQAAWVVLCLRHVVRHNHVFVADFLVDLHGFDEVDVAFIGEGFYEVVAVAADVAEVDVEADLVPVCRRSSG